MKSYLEKESVSVSDWPEVMYFAKLIIDIFQSVWEDTIPEMGCGMSQYV